MTEERGRKKRGPRRRPRSPRLDAVPRPEAPLHPALEAFLKFVGELAAEIVIKKYRENGQ